MTSVKKTTSRPSITATSNFLHYYMSSDTRADYCYAVKSALKGISTIVKSGKFSKLSGYLDGPRFQTTSPNAREQCGERYPVGSDGHRARGESLASGEREDGKIQWR